MGVSSTINRVSYAGDNSSTSFAFPYYFFATTDLVVYLFNVSSGAVTKLTLGANYTVSGVPNAQGVYPNGANVVLAAAPATGVYVTIIRNPPETQNFNLGANGTISSSALVQELDYLTLLTQRLNDAATRSVSLADGAFTAFNPTLPPAIPADAVLATDVTGENFVFLDADALRGGIGPTGPAGATGPTGPTGPAGTNAVTLTVGTTTTGAPASSASVSNSGTSTDPILDFVIPRGLPGPQGVQGIPGADGADGNDGLAATVQVVATTTLDPGEMAYVTNEGDTHQAMFHFYIPRGRRGFKGNPGPQGIQGPPGPTGSVARRAIKEVTSDYAMDINDEFVVVTNAAPATIELASIAGYDGKPVTVKSNGTADVTVIPAAATGETIEGGSSVLINRQDMSLSFISLNGVWYVW